MYKIHIFITYAQKLPKVIKTIGNYVKYKMTKNVKKFKIKVLLLNS